jgi:hypothetical protein
MGMQPTNPEYTAEDLAQGLSAGTVSITSENDLIDAFKVILGYAATQDSAKDVDTGGKDPGKAIEDQAKAQALSIAQYVLANVD